MSLRRSSCFPLVSLLPRTWAEAAPGFAGHRGGVSAVRPEGLSRLRASPLGQCRDTCCSLRPTCCCAFLKLGCKVKTVPSALSLAGRGLPRLLWGPRPLGPSPCRGFPGLPVAVQLLFEDVFISPSVLKGVCPVGGALGGRPVRRGAASDEGPPSVPLLCPCGALAAVKASLCRAFGRFVTLGPGMVSSRFLACAQPLTLTPEAVQLASRVGGSGRCPRPAGLSPGSDRGCRAPSPTLAPGAPAQAAGPPAPSPSPLRSPSCFDSLRVCSIVLSSRC